MALNGFGNSLASVGVGWLFWILFTLGAIIIVMFGLALRKRSKFKFPTQVYNNLGNGKMGIEMTKAGWFKTKTMFFGLIELGGERRLLTLDKRTIQYGSTEDFHEIKHKRGLIVCAKPDDPKMLVPIKRMQLTNSDLMMSIAPADYRDASSRIIMENERELKGMGEKILQAVVWGLMGIIMLVGLILVIQFSKEAIGEANRILDEAIRMKGEMLNSLNVVPASGGAN